MGKLGHFITIGCSVLSFGHLNKGDLFGVDGKGKNLSKWFCSDYPNNIKNKEWKIFAWFLLNPVGPNGLWENLQIAIKFGLKQEIAK